MANIHYHELWGNRSCKYKFLSEETIESISWEKLCPRDPYYFFIPKNYNYTKEFQKGFALDELFPMNVTGVISARDSLVIDVDKKELRNRIKHFANLKYTDEQVRERFFGNKKENANYKKGDTRGWKLDIARQNIKNFNHQKNIKEIMYRPFDRRWIYYTPEMVDWGREKVMGHMLKGSNISLIICRQCISGKWSHMFISNGLTDSTYISNKSKEIGYILPLYRYESEINKKDVQQIPNLDAGVWTEIQKIVPNATPENLFDYIYAVLHARSYRERYAEFLKSDFPRIPYPSDPAVFKILAEKGAAIRELHLLDSSLLQDAKVTYPVSGDSTVGKIKFEDGKVFINQTQCFDGVSDTAWNFNIGSYQPAQKWLKDRKGQKLEMDDIQHYRKTIKALDETARLMREIDQIDFLPKAEEKQEAAQ